MPTQRLKDFVKDHYFVEINSLRVDFYIDPSLKDVMGRECKTIPCP